MMLRLQLVSYKMSVLGTDSSKKFLGLGNSVKCFLSFFPRKDNSKFCERSAGVIFLEWVKNVLVLFSLNSCKDKFCCVACPQTCPNRLYGFVYPAYDRKSVEPGQTPTQYGVHTR